MSLGLLACGCAWLAWRAVRMRACAGRVMMSPPVLLRYSDDSIDGSERTTVSYKHPLSGEYCVRKDMDRGYHEVVNPRRSATPPSPDSGLSDQYEPLNLRPHSPVFPPLPHYLVRHIRL
ncbi:hypothetical protein EVAR_93208_1 [Eumeta japonica]|uniref:Secreted protein n=1 Tax=Eumeta variegata TaxID=151549 RepID=A0A4C1TXR0_EUMVA|nr:hypothetical protein EVAR_93208_1 [Eumeta japonica]